MQSNNALRTDSPAGRAPVPEQPTSTKGESHVEPAQQRCPGRPSGRRSKTLENSNGSKSLRATIAVDDNYKGRDGNRKTQFVQVEAFLPKDHSLGWDRTGKGDLIAVQYRVDTTPYADKDGVMQYPIRLVVEGAPTYLESQAVTAARKAPAAAGATA